MNPGETSQPRITISVMPHSRYETPVPAERVTR